MKKTIGSILIGLTLCIFTSPQIHAAWSLKQATLMTPWASQVDPDQVLPEYPRPQMVRSNWLNLNGLWQYQPGDSSDTTPVGQTLSGEILVPFPVESAISGVMEYHNRLWYRRQFEIPALWTGQRILLHFGAVDWEAQVYVNGQSAGIHKGGYDAFSYDITPYLNPTGPQELIVRVFDPTDTQSIARGKQVLNPGGIMYTPCTGIWQTVWLEPVPQVSIEKLKLTPVVDSGSLKVTATVLGAAANLTVQATAYDNGTAVGTVTGPVGQELTLVLSSTPKLWSPTNPFLYDLEVVLKQNDTPLDTVDSYFGMRKVQLQTIDGIRRMTLNDAFIFEIGPLDQGYWPDGVYTAPTDEALKWDLDMIKAFGFNMVRKHVKVEPARWYYWADKLGLLVWQDMPSMQGSSSAADRTQFESEMQKMVENLHNSPSIILWVVFNEGWGQYDTVRLTNWVMNMDPSRLVSCASGWTDYDAGHVIDWHSYPAPGSPTPTATRAAVCGEYGGIGMKVEGHMWDSNSWGYTMVNNGDELASYYGSLVGMLSSFKDIPGLCAGVYTQITDVEVEINGLITYDRKIIKSTIPQITQANGLITMKFTEVIPTSQQTGYAWKYTVDAPATNWYGTGFNDTAWQEGPAGFGTAGTPGAVVRTTWNSADIWMRRSVAMPALTPSERDNLYLKVHHDEDAEIYINGVLAVSVAGYTSAYARLPISAEAKAAIVSGGQNLLAVHCHQTGGGQYIDIGLDAEIVQDPDACGQWGYAPGDFNKDCSVNLSDLAILSLDWLTCSYPNQAECQNYLQD